MKVVMVGGPYDGDIYDISDYMLSGYTTFPERPLTTAWDAEPSSLLQTVALPVRTYPDGKLYFYWEDPNAVRNDRPAH
jgi:hypothetical protein